MGVLSVSRLPFRVMNPRDANYLVSMFNTLFEHRSEKRLSQELSIVSGLQKISKISPPERKSLITIQLRDSLFSFDELFWEVGNMTDRHSHKGLCVFAPLEGHLFEKTKYGASLINSECKPRVMIPGQFHLVKARTVARSLHMYEVSNIV